ncbi:hypothetical protein SK128_000477 [Halocaridina rubra]|uniref:Methyltransferase domain-containing protein n=1 Tax=Halocaridina rubra TaxID=373956 RepID=A0AAN8X2C9_HALRR
MKKEKVPPETPREYNGGDYLPKLVYEIVDRLRLPQTTCNKLVYFGGHLDCNGSDGAHSDGLNCNKICVKDGYKGVCMDGSLKPMAKDCLILSVGIGNEFSFDNAMARYGCQIYSVDFTMKNWTHFAYAPNQHFLSLGISHSNTEGLALVYEHEGKNQTLRTSMLTLASLLQVLDVRTRIISYLKLDIENDEWEVLEHVLKITPWVLKSVRQLAFEVHLEDILQLNYDIERALPKVVRIRKVLQGLEVRPPAFASFTAGKTPKPTFP